MSPNEQQDQALGQRAQCHRCHLPQLRCICGHLRRVANRTVVWVAQHHRERFHSIGTARIARLGLEKVQVEVLYPGVRSAPPSLPARAGLLYPAPEARDLASLRPDQRPEALVVIDGTWQQARTLHRDHRWLQRLPCYRLTPRSESRYRLRKEPAAACVSTIEAIVEALRILEPTTSGLDDLLATFDGMIDQQIALIHERRCGPRRRNAPRSRQGIPRRFVDEPERFVAIGSEAAPRRDGHRDPLAIVQCVAIRVATGEVFQRFVQPPPGRFPSAQHLVHTGLSAELLQAGSPLQELRARWQRFVTPDDIVVVWNQSVLDALDATVGLPERRFILKSAYRSHAKHVRGPLAALIGELRLDPSVPADLHGRAGRHVAQTAALLTHLQTQSRDG